MIIYYRLYKCVKFSSNGKYKIVHRFHSTPSAILGICTLALYRRELRLRRTTRGIHHVARIFFRANRQIGVRLLCSVTLICCLKKLIRARAYRNMLVYNKGHCPGSYRCC